MKAPVLPTLKQQFRKLRSDTLRLKHLEEHVDMLRDSLRFIADDHVEGGQGQRSVGQYFYQDKVKNIRAYAKSILKIKKP